MEKVRTGETIQDLSITIHSLRPPYCEHSGGFSAPTTNEIAAIVVGQGANQRDISLNGETIRYRGSQ